MKYRKSAEISGRMVFLAFMIFLLHFDQFFLVGFFIKYVQNIPLDKYGGFGADWSCGEFLSNFGILFQLKLGFAAARVFASIIVPLISS